MYINLPMATQHHPITHVQLTDKSQGWHAKQGFHQELRGSFAIHGRRRRYVKPSKSIGTFDFFFCWYESAWAMCNKNRVSLAVFLEIKAFIIHTTEQLQEPCALL